MKKISIMFSIFIILALVFAVKPAQAEVGDEIWLHFAPCSNNDPYDTAIGVDQMWVKLEDEGSGSVKFTFYNYGSGQSSITDVYFADGTLLGISNILESSGVDFEQEASPGQLPSGNTCTPDPFPTVTAGFSADSEPPTQINGVNNTTTPPPGGEWVGIEFELVVGKDWDDVVTELEEGILRIGIHVQGYASGGSETFATNAYTAVELMDFSASARSGYVTVKWVTGTELNNAGFNLYRSSSEQGTRTKLNNTLVAARGDAVSGGSYSFTDAPGYGTFFYWLEDVDLGGTATLHGPVVVTAWPSIRLPVSRPAVP